MASVVANAWYSIFDSCLLLIVFKKSMPLSKRYGFALNAEKLLFINSYQKVISNL
jgi:hypothetical protein